jgi:acetylglutamate kinase
LTTYICKIKLRHKLVCVKKMMEQKNNEKDSGFEKEKLQAEILTEALPYIKDFVDETFVIKYGGSAIGSNKSFNSFIKNICLLKSVGINIIVVHGGGPQIDTMLKKLDITPQFVDGLRVTDATTMQVVEMVLCGNINKFIVEQICKQGQKAVGVSGKDYEIIKAEKLNAVYRKNSGETPKIEELVNLGFVGKPANVNPDFFGFAQEMDFIPVIAPVANGTDGNTYNMNADTVAGAIAVAVGAKKLILLSDVDGVLDKEKNKISLITEQKAKELIADGTISGGMIPKIETAIASVENGVASAHIISGFRENALLLEILTKDGTGTMIVE